VYIDTYKSRSGGNHDIFANAKKSGTMIVVPRHKTVSPGVARKIAKEAGW
jgi:predicted RNA binding protein YcfA (HicA-like mRNA interferase family)